MDKRAIYNCLYLVWMFMDSWRVRSIASISHFVFWQHLYLALRSVFDSQNTLDGRTESCILISPTTNIIHSDVIIVILTLLLRLWSNNDKNFWKFVICHSNLPASIPATSDLGWSRASLTPRMLLRSALNARFEISANDWTCETATQNYIKVLRTQFSSVKL